MKRHLKIAAAAAVLALAGIGSAQATPILVDPTADTSSASITINEVACIPFIGCPTPDAYTELSGGLNAASASLDVGSSWTFDFFDVVVGGLGLVTDATVQAALGFNAPDGIATATGSGGFLSIFGRVSGGLLTWIQPDDIQLGDGSWLNVQFENIVAGGLGNRTTISATVSRHASVPEPATLALLGIGLIGMGLATRRRLLVTSR